MSELDVIYVGFNLNDPAVGQHKAWRQAMALALNIEEVIELFYNGRAIRAQSPIPPGLFGYDASFKSPYGKFDLDAAKKRLAEAGFAGGKGIPELEYLTVSGSDTRQRGEHFAQCMAAIGIRIKVVTCTWPEFLDRLKKQQFQIVGAAWAADYPDPENFLQLLYGPNSSPGENCTSFRNQAFDSLFTQMAVLSDSPERLEIIRKMQTIVAEETPWIPQVHRVQLSLTWPWLQNFKPNDPLRTPFKYYRIDAKQRAEAAQ